MRRRNFIKLMPIARSHQFCTSPATDWTAKKAWKGVDLKNDHAIQTGKNSVITFYLDGREFH